MRIISKNKFDYIKIDLKSNFIFECLLTKYSDNNVINSCNDMEEQITGFPIFDNNFCVYTKELDKFRNFVNINNRLGVILFLFSKYVKKIIWKKDSIILLAEKSVKYHEYKHLLKHYLEPLIQLCD